MALGPDETVYVAGRPELDQGVGGTVSRLSADGTSLVYSKSFAAPTFFISALAVDADSNAYFGTASDSYNGLGVEL